MLDLGNVDEANRKVLDNERIKLLIHVLMKVYKNTSPRFEASA